MSNRLTQTLIYFIITIPVQEGGLPQTFFFWIRGKRTRILFLPRDNFYFFLTEESGQVSNFTKDTFFSFSFSFSYIFSKDRTKVQNNQKYFFSPKKSRQASSFILANQYIFIFFILFFIFIFLFFSTK